MLNVSNFLKYLRKLRRPKNTLVLKLTELKREVNQLSEEIDRGKELKLALQKRLEQYSDLKELTELLSSSLSLKELTYFIIEESFKIVGKSERAFLFLVDESKQELALAASKELNTNLTVKSEKSDAFDKWVLEHRRPLIISDTAKDPRFFNQKITYARPLESLISAPLMLENRILGMLRLEASRANSYTADDLRLLCVITDISAVAVNNARLYKKTEELAIKDGLTGLYVHRYFMERLGEEFKRAKRRDNKFSLLMIDIDHFKHYNDKYGHAAGDLVLQHIANSLHKFADTGDVIARYGGEEFAVILTELSKLKAARIAEDIRKHIAKDSVVLRGKKTHVSVSIGVAAYPKESSNEKELIKLADKNLYRAKKEGRDRVCS